jgi:SAM-dependent methyltransferase
LKSENRQRDHYNKSIALYEAHYDDPTAREYRDRFINEPLLAQINFYEFKFLEAMCGSGQTTGFLLDRGAEVIGIDLSIHAIKRLKKRFPQADAYCGSMLSTGLRDNCLDGVIIVSGLHHAQPYADRVIDECHRILKPDGYFAFGEPHHGSVPDIFRAHWYKRDPLFLANEASINVERIETANKHRFKFIFKKYMGNLAYLIIFNSMVLRLPLKLKRFLAPSLFSLEALIEKFQTKSLACYSLHLWQKYK